MVVTKEIEMEMLMELLKVHVMGLVIEMVIVMENLIVCVKEIVTVLAMELLKVHLMVSEMDCMMELEMDYMTELEMDYMKVHLMVLVMELVMDSM